MRTSKLKQQQKHKPHVFCDNTEIENNFNFVYLGSQFSADGDQTRDIKRRVALATMRCGKLRHILQSPDLGLKLKLRLHEAAVLSILVYG